MQSTNSDGNEGNVLKSVLILGFPMENAAWFDSARADLWTQDIADDEIILNKENASLLGVAAGDAVKLISGQESKLMRVREVAVEQGLTGFRDYGDYSGTGIVSEKTAREVAGLDNGLYPAILAGTVNPDLPDRAMFMISGVDYDVQYLKTDYRGKLKQLNFTIIIGIISLVAIVSSLLFMRQVLIMIGESRRGVYGVLRAIGLTSGQIGAIFAAEALLLSLFSAFAGSVLGVAAGYGIVSVFYGTYSEELRRMTGQIIPIHPHLSMFGAVSLFLLVFLFLAATALVTARKAGRFPVVEALRGGVGSGSKPKFRKRLTEWLMIGIGVYLTVIHFYLAFIDTPSMDGSTMLWACVSWLGACCTILFVLIQMLGRLNVYLQRLLRLIGIPSLSVMLATRYPRSHSGRTYTTALLFALIMMIVTFTVTIMSLIMASGDVEQTPQTVLGNGAYAPYGTEAERERILAVAADDAFIAEHIKGVMVSEPFMLNMLSEEMAQAVVPVTEELLRRELPPLAERAPDIGSDREAWEKVLNDPEAIILPYSYKTRDDVVHPGLKAGDSARFPVFEYKKLWKAGERKQIVMERTFRVVGFAQSEAQEHLIDYYGAAYMNATVVDEFRPYGFKWPTQPDLGYVLFDFDYQDAALALKLEERFALNGVLGFKVPHLNNSATYLMNKQLGNGFVGFAVLSGVISLMGLAIVQYRSVRERGKQIAMMRCVGVPGKQLYWMFMLEGIVISATGLLTGWGIGASGARLFAESAKKDMPAYQTFELSYPFEIILPVVFGLLLMSLFINIAPARAALKLKAADALRRGDE